MASNTPSNGMNATQVCELFAQLAGQLMHPAVVLNAMRPVAELHGVTQLPTEESLLAIRRSFALGHPSSGNDVAPAAGAAPALANGKASKSKKGGDAEAGEKKKRPGRVSPYTMFSMCLSELYKKYAQHPTFIERREALQEKAAAKHENAETTDKRSSAGAIGAMSIAGSFWSELTQERKDAWTALYSPLLEDLNKEKLAGTGDADAISRQMKAYVIEHPKADIKHFLGMKFTEVHLSLPAEPKEEKAGGKKKAVAGGSPTAPTSAPASAVKPTAPAAAASADSDSSEEESSQGSPPAAVKPVAKPAPVAVASPVAASKPPAQQEGKKRKADAATTSAAAPFKAVAAAAPAAASSPPPQLSKKGAAKQSKKEEAAEVVAKGPEKASKKSKAAAAVVVPLKVEPVKEVVEESSEEEESSDE